MPTKAIINWGAHPYGEALRLSHTNNRYQSMLPPELERLIHSYLYRNEFPKRKKVIGDRITRHDTAIYQHGTFYMSRTLGPWIVKKEISYDNELIFYRTRHVYMSSHEDMPRGTIPWACTSKMEWIEREMEEKKQERIKLLGDLPLE